ncbi:hypothetical protein ACIBHX_18435 [Nonomuraea sp. NPDC050536]|uniref:hypothetical protein n=1 Tax=Nonomuraea sp. NPDC050536 TaxID=3364366 RepID=UPI0037C8D61D
MSSEVVGTAITQARDLLRWRSPLRTELWASRLTTTWGQDDGEDFVERLEQAGRPESRLALAALAAVEAIPSREDPDVPDWALRMGRVGCEGAWYGKADPYGEQVLGALAFRYANGKEPHVLVVGIDQVHGGLAVDAVVEEPKFLDDLNLEPASPATVAARILEAFRRTDSVLGAEVAETLPAVRHLALARARSVPADGARDDDISGFVPPEVPGAREAFEALKEFLGDRPLWWSPDRVSRFLTSWLPREVILSDAAIAAMPEVLRAWTGDSPEILRRIDADATRLPELMADESLAGLRKRLTQQQR